MDGSSEKNNYADRVNSEAWRYTGPFSVANRWKGTLPGIGIASVAFAAYCGFEYLFLNDSHGHGDDKHDSTTTEH